MPWYLVFEHFLNWFIQTNVLNREEHGYRNPQCFLSLKKSNFWQALQNNIVAWISSFSSCFPSRGKGFTKGIDNNLQLRNFSFWLCKEYYQSEWVVLLVLSLFVNTLIIPNHISKNKLSCSTFYELYPMFPPFSPRAVPVRPWNHGVLERDVTYCKQNQRHKIHPL